MGDVTHAQVEPDCGGLGDDDIHMQLCLNSLKGGIWGIIYERIIGLIKGDTRTLDCSSYAAFCKGDGHAS